MTILIEAAWKSGAVGGAGLLLLLLMRGARASVRHAICAVTLAVIAILPGVCLALHQVPLPTLTVPVPRPALLPAPVVPVALHERAVVAAPQSVRVVGSPPAATPAPTRLEYRSIGVAAWAAGTLICLAPWAVGMVQVGRLRRQAVRPGDRLSRLAADATEQKGGREIQVFLSPAVSVPLTFGIVCPLVMLPMEAESWPDERVRAALLHEIAHIARQDFLTQALAGLVCAAYWFHPLTWVLSARMRAEAETACDARVVAVGIAPGAYAGHLLEIACGLSRIAVPRAAAAIARTARLEGRITMILEPTSGHLSPRLILVAACGALCLVGIVALRVGGTAEALPPRTQTVTTPLPPAPTSDPAAVEFLKQSMDQYAALKTFRADVDYVMSYSDTTPFEAQPAPKAADYQRTIAYAAPNRFRVTATNYTRLKHFYISDGNRMVILKEGYNQAPESFDAPVSFAVADKNNMNHPHFGGSALYRFFAGRGGYERLIDAEAAWSIHKQKPQAVRFGPDVIVDGAPCKTVIFGGGLHDDERRAIIGTSDLLVRRMEHRESAESFAKGKIAVANTNADIQKLSPTLRQALVRKAEATPSPNTLAVEYYKNVVTDAAIPESEFVVPPTAASPRAAQN